MATDEKEKKKKEKMKMNHKWRHPAIVGQGWGGDGGVLNWAIGIDMYTLICIKLMTDQKKKTKKKCN